ncbi:MAG: phosphatase PAP2 family protein [Solirubrobacterales bacterium]|nr:phosphatase PAP2 family protein [Solirubrobacterales bacterium]
MGWLARRTRTWIRVLALLLVSFAVILGCAIATGELLELTERAGGSTPVDSSLTSWTLAHRTSALTAMARVLSTIGSQAFLIPVVAVVAAALLITRRFALAGLLLTAWAGAILLYNLTKHFVQRPRPPADIWLTNAGHSTSFPSGHATQSLATFLALALVVAPWLSHARWPATALALVLAAGVGWSRVYLGVHWGTDVGAGWLIASAWVAAAAWLAARAHSIFTSAGSPSRSSGRHSA